MADINAALDGLQFKARDGFEGVAHLQVTTNDMGDSGNSGTGGAKTTTDTVNIDTRMTNPPTIATLSSQSILEHQSVVFSQASGNAIRISDTDVGNLPVQVTLATDFGTLSLNGAKGLTFAAGSSSSGATMTFTGTVADINAALDGMKFTPNDYQSNTTAGIRITVNDLSLGHTGATYAPQVTTRNVSVSLIAVNDPPVVTIPQMFGNNTAEITFSGASGNAIRITDPDIGSNLAVMTIMASESTFTLGSTGGLTILGGASTHSTFVMVYGTLGDLNRAIDGLCLSATSSNAAMQISVNDLGANQGVGGAQETRQVFYVRRMSDPNYQPGDSSARFQLRSGVMSQQVSTMTNDLSRGSQESIRQAQFDSAQVNPSLFMSNIAQNMNAVRADGGAILRGSERLVNRDNSERAIEMSDGKDAKTTDGSQFSADTQNMNETAQEGSVMRRDEGILVGLGVVSAGYLAWALHGGSLLAGAISTTPMWMPFDPLAVLDFSDRAAKAGMLPLDQEAGLAGDDNLQSLLS